MLAKSQEKVNPVYGHAFNLISTLGPISLMRIAKYFGSYQAAWEADASQLRQAGLDERKVAEIISKRKDIKPEQSFEILQKHGISMILIGDASYPHLLSEIASPPPILYVRGNAEILNNQSIGVVGTRKMTSYGKHVAQELVSGLVAAKLNIVSGLAFGIDAEALSTTVNLGGYPVTVLASSVDNASISPRANYLLAQKVIHAGCLISEYPIGMPVQKQNFPIRNRIIAGLSLGTLVIEADDESGALITAQFALEQNREVFAVPGSVFSPTSRGTNKLIKSGAKLVSAAEDIIEELNLDVNISRDLRVAEVTQKEQEILDALSKDPLHTDELIQKTKKLMSEVNSILTMLEMKGRVKNLGGSRYIKIR